jgi:hypothetical protein
MARIDLHGGAYTSFGDARACQTRLRTVDAGSGNFSDEPVDGRSPC